MNSIATAILASVSSGGSGQPGAAPATAGTAPAAAPAAPAVHVSVNANAGKQALDDAMKQIRQFIKSSPASLEFTVDQSSKRVMLRIVDSQTHELILQLPSEEVLAIARALDRFEGVFLKQKA